MIKVQDWVASIPDGDKHVAYVGEGMSETREFWLCGEGWEAYRNWSFHLDMAFDPESITTRESRQVVQTHTHSSQMKETAAVNTEESVTKESYTVENEEVQNYNLTDIASLEKRVGEDGIYLTWTVLRQHTVLPGKLWATLRAVDGTAQMVKKSAIMVFEVDAAICAVPAARPSISEMEQIEARVAQAADEVTYCADRAEAALTQSMENLYVCQAHTAEAQKASEHALEYALKAEDVYNFSVSQVSAAAEHKWAALDAAEQAQACLTQAQEHAAKAEEHRGHASNFAHAASEASSAASKASQFASQAAAAAVVSAEGAANAVNACANYAAQCADYADVVAAVESMTYRRINVRDYGAVGDGVTDDRAAILAAFDAAKTMLPCEVYFPAGTYGISDGMYIEMPFGSGGLRICGAGREFTTIKYLASYAELTTVPRWFVFRIWLGQDDKGNAIKPSTDGDWLHDISITGLTAHDPNPCDNAWHPDKGDAGKEETHGFNIYYCKRVSVTDCQFITVGDEAIDLSYCHDAVVLNNHCEGSPASGTSGAAISVGSGCAGVVVTGNTVNGSAPDETLDNGTMLVKANFGIAVESLYEPVRNVVIADNVIRNIHGNGINIAATNDGAGLYNIHIADNIIQGCDNGIGDWGIHPKEGVVITSNTIADCNLAKTNFGVGIRLSGGYTNLIIRDNTIRNTKSHGVYMDGAEAVNDVLLDGNNLENIGAQAMFLNAGKYIIRDCTIKNAGVVSGGQAAIYPFNSKTTNVYVRGCYLTGVRQVNAIGEATEVENTYIEMVDAGGNRVTNPAVLKGNKLKRLVNCQFDGYFSISQDNAIVQGNHITNGEGWMHAITINANGVILTGNCITQTDTKTASKKAIAEGSGKNYNLIMGNICNTAITTAGAQSVVVNNIMMA